MLQILLNIIFSSAILTIVGLSAMLSYYTTKFFNLALAAIISIAAYFTYLFITEFHLPLSVAIPVSILFSICLSISLEIGIFRSMREKKFDSFLLVLASLGLYIILQNLISMIFGDNTKTIRTGDIKVGNEFLGAYITNIQIVTILTGIIVFIFILLLINKTSLGRQIRAISGNQELCDIYGINSNRVILQTTAISAGLAAIVGILIALDVGITPTFGFNYFLYGIVAMIIGGVGGYRGLILGSLLLATAQHLVAYYIDTKWMDAIAYVILILFLIWKPLGFSGQKLKKVEV